MPANWLVIFRILFTKLIVTSLPETSRNTGPEGALLARFVKKDTGQNSNSEFLIRNSECPLLFTDDFGDHRKIVALVSVKVISFQNSTFGDAFPAWLRRDPQFWS